MSANAFLTLEALSVAPFTTYQRVVASWKGSVVYAIYKSVEKVVCTLKLCYSFEGMDYMPADSSLAAFHRRKLKNLYLTTRQESDASTDLRACILKFEKEALSYDDKMKRQKVKFRRTWLTHTLEIILCFRAIQRNLVQFSLPL